MKIKLYVNTEENPESPDFIMAEKEYQNHKRKAINEYTHDETAFSEWLNERYDADCIWYADEDKRKEIWDEWENYIKEVFDEETPFICKELKI